MSSLQFVYPVVAVVCSDLTNAELLALNLAVQLDNDPRGVKGVRKGIEPLYRKRRDKDALRDQAGIYACCSRKIVLIRKEVS